jgi:hypothetical protein
MSSSQPYAAASLAVVDNGWVVSSVQLGATPVLAGTDAKSHIQLPVSSGLPAVCAEFTWDGQQVQVYNRISGQSTVLRAGSQVQFGQVTMEVQISSRAPRKSAAKNGERQIAVAMLAAACLLAVFALKGFSEAKSNSNPAPFPGSTNSAPEAADRDRIRSQITVAQSSISNILQMYPEIVSARNRVLGLTVHRTRFYWLSVARANSEFAEAWKAIEPSAADDLTLSDPESQRREEWWPSGGTVHLPGPVDKEREWREQLLELSMTLDKLEMTESGEMWAVSAKVLREMELAEKVELLYRSWLTNYQTLATILEKKGSRF